MLLIYVLTARFRRPPKIKNPVDKLVEDALKEDDGAAPPTVSGYTWNDLQRDLHDPKLTFAEILDRCGGRLPQRPVEAPAEDKAPEQEGTKEDKDRLAQLQAWFSKRTEETPVLKVVKPPPQPPPVVTLRGQPLRCPYCEGFGRKWPHRGGMGFTTSSNPGHPQVSPSEGVGAKCERCDGHGYVVISGD
jgi:hypothetical protein